MATTITANGINFPDGSAGSPSIGGTDTNTGLFTGSDIVGFATGGSERLRIDASGNVILGSDNVKLQIGASQDLYFWHNGSTGNSNISNVTGDLYIQGNNGSGTAVNQIAIKSNAAVELNYQGTKKFETQSAGVEITGKLTFANDGLANGSIDLGADADLNLYHDNSDAYFDNNTGDFYIRNAGSNPNQIYIQGKGGENGIIVNGNGQVELYYDNSKKIETTSSGIDVAGSVDISGAGTLVSTGSTTQPLTFKNNGRTGTYNQSCMYAHQNNTSGNSNNGIVFEVGRLTDSSSAEIGKFTIATRGGNIATITDADGIKFNGDTAAANGLDDYEEGTWTPTDGSGASISITNNNTASYTKIGRLVHIKFDVTYASNSSSADATLGGLPYNQGVAYGSGVVGWTNKDNANGIHVHVGTSDIYLMDNSGANSSGGKHLRNDEVSTLRMIGNATYFTA